MFYLTSLFVAYIVIEVLLAHCLVVFLFEHIVVKNEASQKT